MRIKNSIAEINKLLPLVTLAVDSEWDILQVIHRLMTKMKEQPELNWVQSHQDDDSDIDITTLSFGTQLNIKADALAT